MKKTVTMMEVKAGSNPCFLHKYKKRHKHMKKFFKFIWEVILYIWQLPQNLVGLFLRLFYPKAQKMEIANVKVLYDYSFPGGISLGRTIFVGTQDRFTSMHEQGHQIQSMILGPLYLFVIGIPSIFWASISDTRLHPKTHNGYYKFYTERWADKLGGVVRY